MPTFKFTTTTKHTAASESKRRAKFIHHGLERSENSHTHLPKCPESLVEIHPKPTLQCSQTRARVAFKTTWLFRYCSDSERREKESESVCWCSWPSGEGFFPTLRENERLWEENGWRKRKIYEWILFCFALTLFFVYFGSPCLLACCETIMCRGGKSFLVVYNLEGSFRRKLC